MFNKGGKIVKEQLLKISIIFLFFITLSLSSFSVFRIITSVAPDFSVMWLAAEDLPQGNNPYLNPHIFTGVGYPPNTLIYYLPLTPFPYPVAQALFIVLSFFSIIGSILLTLKIVFGKISLPTFLLTFSLAFLSFPTKYTLGMGQNNSLALIFLLASFYFYQKKNDPLSGIFLGLAVSLKTIFGFFFLFFLIKKAWRVILSAVIPLAVSFLLVILFSGINLYFYYIKEVIPPLLNFSGREVYYNQGILGFVSRLTDDLALRKSTEVITSFVLTTLVVFLSLNKKKEALQFSFFIVLLLLIDSLSWQHHFIWLLFPFVLLIKEAIEDKKTIILFLIGIAYLLVSWNFKNPSLFSDFPRSLVLSNTFYGALILFLINTFLILKTKSL